jgi:hypothetical protein
MREKCSGHAAYSGGRREEISPVPVPTPDAHTRWRCTACGNLTRFDVVRLVRSRDYVHVDLSGEPVVEEREVVSEIVEHVTCRWCNAVDTVEIVARPDAAAPDLSPAEVAAERAAGGPQR